MMELLFYHQSAQVVDMLGVAETPTLKLVSTDDISAFSSNIIIESGGARRAVREIPEA
jgi:hypothetical protein